MKQIRKSLKFVESALFCFGASAGRQQEDCLEAYAKAMKHPFEGINPA